MNTFKKTLLACTLVSVASASFGATLHPTKDKNVALAAATPSIQAVATADFISVAGPKLLLGTNYGVGDTITVTYSGAAFDSSQEFSTALISSEDGTDGGSSNPATCGDISMSYAGLQGTTTTYIVQAVAGAHVDCSLGLPAVKVDGASLASTGTFGIEVETSRGYGVLESIAKTALVTVGADEITLAVAATDAADDKLFDEVVDVEEDRYELVGETADVAEIVIADAANGAVLQATSLVTITGDFSWAGVSTTNTTTGVTTVAYGAAEMAVAATGGGSLGAIVRNATTFSFVAATAGTYTVTLTPQAAAKKVTLPTGAYTLAATLDYKNGSDNVIQTDSVSASLGSWGINGASITAYGISNSPSVTPMVWIQNGGVSNGAISGSVNCNGSTITIADLGTAAAKSNTKVGEAIQAAVDAAGTCPTVNMRYDATVTVNGPAADITMNASYKVTAADGATDRVMLETSDSLPSSSDAAHN